MAVSSNYSTSPSKATLEAQLVPSPISVGTKRARDETEVAVIAQRQLFKSPIDISALTCITAITAEAPAQPTKTPDSKKRRAFSVGSPGTPLSPATAAKIFGKVKSPYQTHNPNIFNKDVNLNSHKKKDLANLGRKEIHTFEVGSPLKHSHPKKQTPDKNGLLRAEARVYTLHPTPNPSGENSLIPVRGRNLIRLTGAEAKNLQDRYKQSPINEPFEAFLTREAPKIHKLKFPTSTQTLETTGLNFFES